MSRRVAAVLVFLVAWLLVGVRFGQAAGDPLDGRKITGLHFKGNRKTENEAIKQNLSLFAGDNFLRERLREDGFDAEGLRDRVLAACREGRFDQALAEGVRLIREGVARKKSEKD